VSKTEVCKGDAKTEIQKPSKLHSQFIIPQILSTQTLVVPMPDGNSVSGSFDPIDTNLFAPTVVAEHVEWKFYRNTNVPAPGP